MVGLEKVQNLKRKMRHVLPMICLLLLWTKGVSANTDRAFIQLNGDVELKDLLEMGARWKKKNILIDSKLKGKVRLYTHEAMSEQEVWEMILSTLRVSGFTVLETSRLLKVVPANKLREQSSLTVTSGGWSPRSETLVTKVIPLQRGRAKILQNALKPLMPAGDLLAFEEQSALLAVGSGHKVKQIQDLVEQLDAPESDYDVRLMYLKVVQPSAVAKKINLMLKQSKMQGWSCLPFDEVGAVILSGRTKSLNMLAEWVRKLDQAPRQDRSKSSFRIFPLFHTDAATVAKDVSTLYREKPQHDHPKPGEDRRTMTLTPWGPGNSILMTGTHAEQVGLARLLRKVDRMRTQVYLNVEILEIADFHGFQFESKVLEGVASGGLRAITGWNAATPLAVAGSSGDDQTSAHTAAGAVSSFGQNLVFGALGLGGIALPGVGTIQASRFIEMLKADTRNRSLSHAQLLAVEGQESKMAVGETVFVRTEQAVGSSSSASKYEKEEVGLQLDFVPHVSEEKNVTLKMKLEQTSFAAPQEGARASIQKMKTQQVFSLGDRQTLVVAGLESLRELEENSKIPLLGDIPLLGALFRKAKSRQQGGQVMVFVTPQVVYDASHLSDSYVEGPRRKASATVLSSERLRNTDPRKGM